MIGHHTLLLKGGVELKEFFTRAEVGEEIHYSVPEGKSVRLSQQYIHMVMRHLRKRQEVSPNIKPKIETLKCITKDDKIKYLLQVKIMLRVDKGLKQ